MSKSSKTRQPSPINIPVVTAWLKTWYLFSAVVHTQKTGKMTDRRRNWENMWRFFELFLSSICLLALSWSLKHWRIRLRLSRACWNVAVKPTYTVSQPHLPHITPRYGAFLSESLLICYWLPAIYEKLYFCISLSVLFKMTQTRCLIDGRFGFDNLYERKNAETRDALEESDGHHCVFKSQIWAVINKLK